MSRLGDKTIYQRENIDVVIASRGEPFFPTVVSRIRKNTPANRLILVGSNDVVKKFRHYVDYFIPFDEPNIGKARGLGLECVETRLYASIDSDVLICRNWYDWCRKAIDRENTGAAQGFEKNISGVYPVAVKRWLRRGASYQGVQLPCGLGNTLLKTEVVRKVGMPEKAAFEDVELAKRMKQAGYSWVSNLDLVSTHLKNDVDVWKHWARWACLAGDSELTRAQLKNLLFDLLLFRLREKSLIGPEYLFDIAFRLSYILGKIKSLFTLIQSRSRSEPA